MEMPIKERRTALGMTQEQIAQMLDVSQQTVARWEKGDSPPTKYLKDLALVLNCRIDELLGSSKTSDELPASRREWLAKSADKSAFYGTMRLAFRGGDPRDFESRGERRADDLRYEYPISEQQHHYARSLPGWGWERSAGWLAFETLDGRKIFVNLSALDGITFLSEAVEAMPSYEPQELYAALADYDLLEIAQSGDLSVGDAAASPWSRKFLEVCAELVKQQGIDEIERRYQQVTIETRDGQQIRFDPYEEEGVYSDLHTLEMKIDDHGAFNGEELEPNQWWFSFSSEGYHRGHYMRLGAIRLIEVPLDAYRKATVPEDLPDDDAGVPSE